MVHNVIVVLVHAKASDSTGLYLHWIQKILHSTDGYLQLWYIRKERMGQYTCTSKRSKDGDSALIDHKHVNFWVIYLKVYVVALWNGSKWIYLRFLGLILQNPGHFFYAEVSYFLLFSLGIEHSAKLSLLIPLGFKLSYKLATTKTELFLWDISKWVFL